MNKIANKVSLLVEEKSLPKILIVDDVLANLTAVETLLKPLNTEVITSSSGNSGLTKAIELEGIALILLDVNMPDMDGFEVAELLHSIEETASIPIIFLTAQEPSESNQIRGHRNGAVDYIIKPINPDILLSKVQIFLNIWTMRSSLEKEIIRRVQAEKNIEHIAKHDVLTNLPNRRHIHENLVKIINQAKRQTHQLAVLFLDLDGFKKVNDELGHEAGDVFLKELAARFKKSIRNFDLIARYGGDEFVIILADIEDPHHVTTKLHELIDVASLPVFFHGNEMRGGVSIGVSIYPEHGINSDTLIDCADNAMYQAKQSGRNTFKFYTQALNDAIQRKLLLEVHLRKAQEHGEFELYYQPIVDVRNGLLIGAEALIRWFNPQLGFISPVEFIEIAENIGVIHPLGIWVLDEAVKVMCLHPQLSIAINVSALQFNNDQLVDAIDYYLDQQIITANQLVIEITEGILLENSNEVRERLERIKNRSVMLSIDDFGTGYSSLSYLKRCPVNKLKIDRAFVIDVPNDQENATLIKGIIAMSHALNMHVVAEGVETIEQWEFLATQQCDTAQGFYFSKPLKLSNFTQYIENENTIKHENKSNVSTLTPFRR